MSRLIKILLLFETGLVLAIFLHIHSQKNNVLSVSSHLPDLLFDQPKETISIIFTGDVMLGRSVNTRIQKYADPTWPFKNIANVLSAADVTIVNLESPFSIGCQPTDTGMLFCADPHSVFGLVYAGVDIASLSNNHINNQGREGVDETVSILKENGIIPTGLGKPEFKTVKNIKIAILSFCDLPQMNEKEMASQISDSKNDADIIITTFHWGQEYQKNPSSRQTLLAHLAIDSGADIVVGHHPHWIQTDEVYKGKPIYYSLGNLIFDQMWSEETRLGEILKVTYQNTTLLNKEVTPIKIFDYGQPSIL